jgi:hypothetical protein
VSLSRKNLEIKIDGNEEIKKRKRREGLGLIGERIPFKFLR